MNAATVSGVAIHLVPVYRCARNRHISVDTSNAAAGGELPVSLIPKEVTVLNVEAAAIEKDSAAARLGPVRGIQRIGGVDKRSVAIFGE